jgi:hypothetical protein
VSEIVERTYGNWRVPKSPGIAGLDLLGSVLLLGGVLTVIVTIMFAGLLPALALLLLLGVSLGMLTIKDRHGINGAQRVTTRRGWRTAYKTRQHQYRSGPIGRTRHGACQLPGVLAPTKLTEFSDSWGRPFAVLSLPTPGHFSITFSAQPEGGSLVDRDQTDEWVAQFGQALGQLGEEVGVIAAAVTIETVPDTGRELHQQVVRRIDANAPALARAALLEVAERYPAGSAQTRAWITLVFASELDGKRLKVDEFAQAVKPRVRALGESFHGSGVGLVQPLSAQELCETARVAFDPAVGELLEENRLDGVETAHQTGWDSYLHDSGLSMTWGMTIAPRGTVQSSVLRKLLAPSGRVARKRVTIVYRVIDPGDAAVLVERDQRTAEFNLGTARRKSKVKEAEVLKADMTAREQERGAGLVDFAILLTATVDANDPDAKQIAEAAIDNLSSTARITLRKLYGSQDSAFAACLPLGVLLPDYLRVPKLVQRATA